MKQPAATNRSVSVEEAIEEITDVLSVIIRSFGPIQQAHITEQLEALAAERRQVKSHSTPTP